MIKESSGIVNACFEYTDEFGNTTILNKTVDSNYMMETQIGVLNELFKDFILASGFSYLGNKRIEWVEDNR